MRGVTAFSLFGRAAALLVAFVVISGLGAFQPARADTVASLLGNYTVNQFAGIRVDKKRVKLHFVVVYGQLPALTALHKADTNGDGVTSQTERNAYAKKLAPGFAKKLKITVGGRPVPLKLASWTSSLPSESTGFSLRLDAHYIGKLPSGVAAGVHRLKFDNGNFSGRVGWHEIVVKSGPGMSIFNTNAFSSSLTDQLSVNPEKLPPGGPLNERTIHLAFSAGAAPPGATLLAPRNVAGNKVAAGNGTGKRSGIRATGVASTWLNRQTKSLVDLISARHLSIGVILLALLISLALGALHAFSPGHGKTVVGAYLIGSRGTIRHAIFLGLTVTITHTLGVFALGLATLFAAQFVMPGRLFPILSLVSGLLVVVIGLALFIRRLRGSGHSHGHSHGHNHSHSHGPTPAFALAGSQSDEAPLAEAMAADANAAAPAHAHAHEHEPAHVPGHAHGHHHHHAHPHGHGRDDHHHGHRHDQAHGDEQVLAEGTLMHSHGGRMHTHLPPGAQGEKVTWKSLLGLGISGGLIPCPSAMVLLLATIALHKTAYGLILVLAFSVGLAITLSCVGMAFLYARRLFGRARVPGRLVRILPAVSAAIITCIGIAIVYGAIAGVSLRI
jgi:ABC-type nickel/cobalt efflux system permease component RcnA